MPSRKVYILLMACVLIVCGVIVSSSILKNRPEEKEPQTKPTSLQVGIASDLVNKDTDKDGLFDWEENLRGTNINQKDTDGDGTEDKAEVEANRNPLVKGPNDVMTKNILTQTDYKTQSQTDSNSLTSQMSISLVSGFADLNNQGLDNTANTQTLINNIFDEASQRAVIKNRFDISKIQPFYEKDKDKIKTYFNSVAQIELEEYFKIYSEQKPGDINFSVTTIKNMANRLSYIPVPADLINIHLRMINSFDKLGTTMKVLAEYEKDPALALIYLEDFKNANEEIKNTHNELLNQIKSNEIIFNDKEAGKYLGTINKTIFGGNL